VAKQTDGNLGENNCYLTCLSGKIQKRDGFSISAQLRLLRKRLLEIARGRNLGASARGCVWRE